MRDFKFRAWDEKVKAFVYSEYNTETQVFESYVEDNVFSIDGDREYINQYTGIKDKNGVEIYEGDIVEFEHIYIQINPYEKKIKKYIGEVINHGLWITIGKYPLDAWDKPLTVIGNIYENK